MPQYMKEIVAEITHLARRSHDVSQRSGVSVRMSVANYENMSPTPPAARSASASGKPRRASPTWRRDRLDHRQDRARDGRRDGQEDRSSTS